MNFQEFKKIVKGLSGTIWTKIWAYADTDLKRLFLYASLHSALTKCGPHQTEEIKSLNESLNLVKDHSALKLPMLYARRIWGNLTPLDKIDITSDRFIQRVIKKTPCWLRYTEDQEFREDLQRYMSFCQTRCTA